MGAPCAGQSSVSFDPATLENVKLSVSSENFGLAPPIGSV